MVLVRFVLVLFTLLNGAIVSPQSVPELTLLLNGEIIPEHEALDKEDVGLSSNVAGALSVVTPTTTGDLSFHQPDDFEVPLLDSNNFYWRTNIATFANGSRIIRMTRREDIPEQSPRTEGIWSCSVPTDGGGQRDIFFGLYSRGLPSNGVLTISQGLTVTAVSPLLTEPPTITLTAVTTGGPPGSVEWRVGSTVLTDNTVTLTTRSSATYTHTVTVTGRHSDPIVFTASNRRTSPAPSSMLSFPNPPTNVQASQVGDGQVQVTWTLPTETRNGIHFSVTGQQSTILGSDTTTHTISNVAAGNEISVVSLSSMNGRILYSTAATTTVGMLLALPTPVILQSSSALSSTSLRVEWSLSSGSGNKAADEMRIGYTRTSCSTESGSPISLGGSLRTRDIDGLDEFSMYDVTVTAVYRFGSNPPVMKESDEMILQTSPAPPSGAPQGLMELSTTNTSITLTWNEVVCLDRNGVITDYMIRNVGDPQTIIGSSSSRSYTVEGLSPFTDYSFSVAAVNSNGTGPFSDPSVIRTADGTPSEVVSLTLTPQSTSVEVSWSAPVTPNGIIIRYEITTSVDSTVRTITNTTLSATVSSLQPETNVTITVRAVTGAGAGPGVTSTTTTLSLPQLTLLLRDEIIPENEVLDKEDVGIDEAGALSVLTPYSGTLSFHYPINDQRIPESGFFWITSTETFTDGLRILRLRRRRNERQCCTQEGVWRCSFPSDANGGRQNIYFGLYTRSETNRGILSIPQGPTLTAVSTPLTEPPTYTLTARTTGGPPGSVQWTLDGVAIPDSTATVNIDSNSTDDRESAHYTHTLMVIGRQSGVIRFTASNNRTSPPPSSQFTITFPNPPTNVQASQVGDGQIQVTWTRPTGTHSGFSVSLNNQSSTSTSSETTTHSLSGITSGTHDISVVSLYTTNGHQLYSTEETDMVEVLALPTPVISSSSALSSTSLRVEWSLSSGSGDKAADDFIITYTRTSCPPEVTGSVTVDDGSLRTRDIDGLEEFSTYTVSVTAVYRFGGSNQPVMKESAEMEVQTSSAAPSSAPPGISVQNVMATSVEVSWNELACLDQNGVITGYIIQYVGDSQTITVSSSGASRTYTVEGLIPFTDYSFSVAAVNGNRNGPFSEQPMNIRTLKSTPGVVDSLTLGIKFRSVVVSWSTPLRPNGIITQYEVTYSVNGMATEEFNTMDNTTLNYIVSSLEPGSNVTVTVRAFNSIGPGEPITINNSTLTAPPKVTNVQVSNIDGTSVRVTWDPLDIPEITGYRVYYSLSESRKRQSDRFIEVEGQETNSATVGGLTSGSTYTFTVVGVARLDGEDPIIGERPPIPFNVILLTPPACQYVGAVVGSVFATLLVYTVILLIVLLVCFCWRKKQSTYNVEVKSQQQPEKELSDEEGAAVYDVIEPTDKAIPLKQCAAYGDVQTRQRTAGNEQDVGIYENPPI